MPKENSPVSSGQEYVNFMMKLMRDVRNGDVSPQAATAAVKAGDSAIKMMEMQLRWGQGEGQKTDLLLESAEVEGLSESSETEMKPLDLVIISPAPNDSDPEEEFDSEMLADEGYIDESELEEELAVLSPQDRAKKLVELGCHNAGLCHTIWWKKTEGNVHRISDKIIEVDPSMLAQTPDRCVAAIIKSLDRKTAKSKHPQKVVGEIAVEPSW